MKSVILLFILALSPVILIAAHILLIKISKLLTINLSGQYSLLMCMFFLNIPFLGTVFILYKSLSWTIYSFIVFNCLNYSYFHFFNMSETARRIKILLEIKTKNAISEEELQESYRYEEMIPRRLERLIAMKQVFQKDEKYYLKGKMLFICAIIIYEWRKILGLDDGEFFKWKKSKN